MQVRSIRWVGVATDAYDPMLAFVRDVLGMREGFVEPTTAEFETSEGDAFQVMAPGDPYYDFFAEHATGPVPLLEVDDLDTARSALEQAGIEIVGDLDQDAEWEWLACRAPDGNLYELASRRKQ